MPRRRPFALKPGLEYNLLENKDNVNERGYIPFVQALPCLNQFGQKHKCSHLRAQLATDY